MSGNHNRSLERALAIVDAAAAAGAHAIKLQTYTADTLTLDLDAGDFRIAEENSPWYGRSLHDLYDEAHTPWEWHAELFARSREHGMLCFSTPFDDSSVDFLEQFDPPCYKIASFENVDLPLIRKVASTGRPIMMSTGMATLEELAEAVSAARDAGCDDIVLLKCTSSYPASPAGSNIATLPHLRETFGCQVGLSDHSLGVGPAIAAIALGATVVEKHFTLSREEGGVDAAFSMEPNEMAELVEETKKAWQALGVVSYGPTDQEAGSLRFRRSLYVSRDMKAGEEFSTENLRSVRPGYGLEPKYYSVLLGKRVNCDVKKGTRVSWDLFG